MTMLLGSRLQADGVRARGRARSQDAPFIGPRRLDATVGWALTRVGERSPLFLMMALLLGGLFPSHGLSMQSALPAAAILITLGSFLTALASGPEIAMPRLAYLVSITATGAVPCILVWSATALFAVSDDLAFGMILSVAGPPVAAAAALAGLLGLAPRLAFSVSLPLLVLSPFWLPLFASLFGVGMMFDMGRLTMHLFVMIGGAAVLTGVIRAAGRRSATVLVSPTAAAGVSVIGLALIGLIAAGTARKYIDANWLEFARLLWIAFAASLGLWLAGILLFLRLGHRRSMTLGFLFGNRNQSLIWAAAGTHFSALAEAYFVAAIVLSIVLPSALRLALDGRDHLRLVGARLRGS